MHLTGKDVFHKETIRSPMLCNTIAMPAESLPDSRAANTTHRRCEIPMLQSETEATTWRNHITHNLGDSALSDSVGSGTLSQHHDHYKTKKLHETAKRHTEQRKLNL